MREQYLNELVAKCEADFPGFDHSIMLMITALSNAHHTFSSVLERALAATSITQPAMDVLFALYLRQEDGRPLGEIAELLMVSPANITGLVDGLVKKGFVMRGDDPRDRRKRQARITDKGISFMEQFIPRTAVFLQKVFTPMTEEDKLQLYERLQQIVQLLTPYWEKRLIPCLDDCVPDALPLSAARPKKR